MHTKRCVQRRLQWCSTAAIQNKLGLCRGTHACRSTHLKQHLSSKPAAGLHDACGGRLDAQHCEDECREQHDPWREVGRLAQVLQNAFLLRQLSVGVLQGVAGLLQGSLQATMSASQLVGD